MCVCSVCAACVREDDGCRARVKNVARKSGFAGVERMWWREERKSRGRDCDVGEE